MLQNPYTYNLDKGDLFTTQSLVFCVVFCGPLFTFVSSFIEPDS